MSNEEQKSITPGIYLWLIAVNIYISMFAFGGGYVVVPVSYTHLTLPTTSRV